MSSSGGQIYGVQNDPQEIINLEYRIIKNPNEAINAVGEHSNEICLVHIMNLEWKPLNILQSASYLSAKSLRK